MHKTIILIFTLLFSPSLFSFDYLEHSYFTDKACWQTQLQLASSLNTPREIANYLALAIYCPINWDKNYCHGDYKMAQGLINSLDEHPIESHLHSLTLGDISALPDHTDRFGHVANLPLANRPGVLSKILDWLVDDKSDADGFIGDVAEDACETAELTSWKSVESDLRKFSKIHLYREYFQVGNRSQIQKGPSDPAGAYSFDNPQYLDLVLKNHHHFGARAYRTWLGLHKVAIEMTERKCESLLVHEKSCSEIAKLIKKKLLLWSKTADARLVDPIRKKLPDLELPLLMQTLSSFIGLTFEGFGIHFLQDNLAGGHIRTNRSSHNLEDARYYHDLDGEIGLQAEFTGTKNISPYMAYGDGYILGKGAGLHRPCRPGLRSSNPKEVTNCLLAYQRGLILQTTKASLLHWASGGKTYDDYLATQKVSLPGTPRARPTPQLAAGNLPLPKPDFSYQSLLLSTAKDNSGELLQNGIKLVFLSSLGDETQWLTSYNYGLFQSRGEIQNQHFQQLHGEFSYSFHWRWAARFLINAAPYLQFGSKNLGNSKSTIATLGPRFGITFLPEGWIRMPLDITLEWKVPYNIFESNHKTKTDGVGKSWVELSIGLSFM